MWYNTNSEREVIKMAIKMNKVSQKSKRVLTFDDLIVGDVFSNDCGDWFIRTRNIYDDCGDLIGNAIELDGDFACFNPEDTVRKFKKDLTIEYSNNDITEWYEN